MAGRLCGGGSGSLAVGAHRLLVAWLLARAVARALPTTHKTAKSTARMSALPAHPHPAPPTPPRSTIKFDKNAAVLVNAKGQPVGTRVLGFVTHELRARQMMKVLSLAARVF